MAVARQEIESVDQETIGELSPVHEYLSWEEFLEPSETIRYMNIRSVNARPWVLEMQERYGNPSLTMATLPSESWDDLTFDSNIDAIYIIGIYESSEEARLDSIRYLPDYKLLLRDDTLTADTVFGSGFATISDRLHPMVASSWDEWDTTIYGPLREKGIEVGVDFIPNHVALDHPWRDEHPEYILQVDKKVYESNPRNYLEYTDKQGRVHYFARGKHYTVEGQEEVWTDTLQLDYRNPQLRQAKIDQLVHLVEHADIARVDTAPLPVYEIFKKTWGNLVSVGDSWDFWGDAVAAVNRRANELGKRFRLLGEAYDSAYVLGDFYGVYGSPIYGEAVKLTNGRGSVYDVKRELARAQYQAEHGGPFYLLFAENHDLKPTIEIFGDYQKTLAALSITIMTPGDWLLHHGEELLRLNPPMQVIKPYVQSYWPHLVNDLRLQYERFFAIRRSKIVQEGTPTVPYTSSSIIAQQYDYVDKGLIMCTNLSGQAMGEWIPLPEGLTKDDIDVYDLDALQYVDHDRITDPAANGNVFVYLDPWHRQVVMYKKRKFEERESVVAV